jgi:hypothetical protein
MSGTTIQFLSLVFLGLVLAGCAQTPHFTPAVAPVNIQLPGLPANVVDVQVKDLRPERPGSDTLSQVLKAQIVTSLSADPAPLASPRCRLMIDVIEHRAFFTIGNWNASTRLRARLVEAGGKVLGQWEATGSASRSNMFGYATANAVSQDSYNIAVSDLLSSLTPVSVRQLYPIAQKH